MVFADIIIDIDRGEKRQDYVNKKEEVDDIIEDVPGRHLSVRDEAELDGHEDSDVDH